jgi:glucose-1-phosphate thymidylyltransferase
VKGIILAGGLGTRLSPLTEVASKQLLPVYDKPLIFYSLSTLILANIKEILIISTPAHIDEFKKLISDGSDFGCKISYEIQKNPAGIAESLILAEKFLNGSKCVLALGDNIFHGSGLGRKLEQFINVNGSQVFGYKVSDPSKYGIASLNDKSEIVSLVEKPEKSLSSIAIPGLYFFDETASDRAKKLSPSKRNELEILDLLKSYLVENLLKIEMLPRGTAWFDCGTFDDLLEASSYVQIMQKRTGESVGDPLEVGRLRGWIH